MAFVNETMSASDIETYRIEEINQRFNRSDLRPHWTRDRARDIYLRQVAQGREEFSNQADFTFLWRDTLYVLRLLKHSRGQRGGTGWLSYGLLRLDPEPAVAQEREQLLTELKAALTAHGAGGVFADMTVDRVSFDF